MLNDLGFTKAQLNATFMYLFRAISNREFRSYFDDGIQAKRKFDNNGYVLLNCKLYAWARYNGLGTPKEYCISTKDARFLRTLDLSHVSQKFKVWGLQEFRDTVEQQLFSKDMDVYIGKFISKKLIFLRSYGLSRYDMQNDLRIAGMYSVYRMFPMFQSDLHIKNIAKMAIKRAGQELIYRNTRQGKQALRKKSDGQFESRLVPWDAAVAGNMFDSEIYHPKLDLTRCAERLSAAYDRATPRAKRFILLLTGEHDETFSRFLGLKNDKAYNSMDFEEYLHRVQMHLGITDGQRDRFFTKIRRM